MNLETTELMKAAIQAQVVKALSDDQKLLDTLIGEALKYQVTIGNGYNSKQVPFLQYTAGELIREAAKDAIKEYMADHTDAVREKVKAALSADGLIDGITNQVMGVMNQDWRLNVTFADKAKDY